MKSTNNIDWNELSKSFKQFLKEAEKEEDPFAAADDKGGEEASAEDGEKEDGKEKTATEKPAGVPVKFDISKVKKYNTAKFLSDTGTVKSIDKDGVVVTTQPDQVDVLVNFDDISETIKRFFKSKK